MSNPQTASQSPHLTVWFVVDGEETERLSKRQIAAFQASVKHLVAFAKAEAGLPQVENWSMFGTTSLCLDLPLDESAVKRLTTIARDPAMPKIDHFVLIDEVRYADRLETADPAIVSALRTQIATLGLRPWE